MAKEHYTLTVEPVTCVHIGTGEQLSPLDYKIEDNLFVNFSSDSILKRIAADPEKSAEFERLSSGGDMKALADFFHENAKKDDINYSCHCTMEFLKIWEANKDKDPLQNGRFVEQMYRQDMAPVIPGSSLKGAVRTAVLKFVTFDENFRSPKTRKGKDGKPLPYGKTRTVFNYDGLYLPFGWCKCSFIPLEEK